MSIGNARYRIRSAGLTVLFLLCISPAPLFAQSKEMPLTTSKEALALGSVSRVVMPGTSRRVLAQNLNFLMRTYTPSAMSGPQREFE